jgi:integrase
VPKRCRCSATWSYRLTTPAGRRLERSGFATKAEAQTALADQVKQLGDGTWRQVQQIGFADFAEKWLATYATPNVKPSTLVSYQGAVRNHLVPYFGDTPLTKITKEGIERYLADKIAAVHPQGHAKAGQPVWSRKTIHNTWIPLREALAHAVEWGYLVASPAASGRPVKREQPEREGFTWAEVESILAVAGEPWALVFRTAALTGLRRGELLGLRWSDLELDRARLHVRQSFGRYGIGTPKSRAGRRVVPLTPDLVEHLRRHRHELIQRELRAGRGEPELVFCSVAGTPLDPDNTVRAWARAVRKAGLRHLGLHSLRHTAVSLFIAHEGLNPKQLSSIIGHASIQLTYDTYAHLMPDSFEGFGQALDALAGNEGAEAPADTISAAAGNERGTTPLRAVASGA